MGQSDFSSLVCTSGHFLGESQPECSPSPFCAHRAPDLQEAHMTRSHAIAKHIAKAIVRNRTKKHWSGLHSDAISALEREIIVMSNSPNPDTCTSQVPTPAVKQTGYRTITGSNPGDHRPKTAPAVMPENPAPRDGMTQANLCSSKLTNPAPVVTAPGLDSDAGN